MDEQMFFGQKLRELRLEAKMGSRKIADKLDMKVSDYYNIENGYAKPLDALWVHLLIEKLEIGFQSDEAKELVRLYNEPFVMQKMSECGGIAHASVRISEDETVDSIDDMVKRKRAATTDELIGITEHINKHVREHNEKADAYNKENGAN